MDVNNHFITLLSSMDEAYFIAFSNKGTYKRAVKDLEASPMTDVRIEANMLHVQLQDGTTVTFTNDARAYSCTCAARTVCKHVIMALLAAKDVYGSGAQEQADFSSLLHLSIQDIVSEKVWEEIVFREQFHPNIEFEEGSVLIASFPDENIVVRFLSSVVHDSVCTCKEEAVCRHRAEALYIYQKKNGIAHKRKETVSASVVPEQLSVFQTMIENMMYLGLTRLSEHNAYELEHLAVQARALRLYKLENLFRRLAADVQLYRSKHASFRIAAYRETISSLYVHMLLLRKQRVEEHSYRSGYYEVPSLVLHGLGASGWQTKSGYTGVTYYFYSLEQRKQITYTQSRPTFYEGSNVTPDMLHEQPPPWGLAGTGFSLSRSTVSLNSARLNADFQLSSSSQTEGTWLQKTNIEELSHLFLASWEKLLGCMKRERGRTGTFWIEVCGGGEWTWNEHEQHWTIPLIDRTGHSLSMRIAKRAEAKRMLSSIKLYMEKPQFPKRMLVRTYHEGGKVIAAPLVLYTGQGDILNVTLNERGTPYERAFTRSR